MSDPLRPVSPGDALFGRLRDSRTFNLLLDAAKQQQEETGDRAHGADRIIPYLEVYILPTSTVLPGYVVVPTAIPHTFPAHSIQAQRRPICNVAAPSTADDVPLIVTKPATAGGLGRAVAQGLAVTFVNVTDAAHEFAVPIPSSMTGLVSATAGPVRIIRPRTTGNLERLVMLTGEGGGASGTGITVDEVDGSPTLTDVERLRFDQADGFIVSTVSPTIARIDIVPASPTQAGVVSITTQHFGGFKVFDSTAISHAWFISNGFGVEDSVGYVAWGGAGSGFSDSSGNFIHRAGNFVPLNCTGAIGVTYAPARDEFFGVLKSVSGVLATAPIPRFAIQTQMGGSQVLNIGQYATIPGVGTFSGGILTGIGGGQVINGGSF